MQLTKRGSYPKGIGQLTSQQKYKSSLSNLLEIVNAHLCLGVDYD